jgi:hypothetical protein
MDNTDLLGVIRNVDQFSNVVEVAEGFLKSHPEINDDLTISKIRKLISDHKESVSAEKEALKTEFWKQDLESDIMKVIMKNRIYLINSLPDDMDKLKDMIEKMKAANRFSAAFMSKEQTDLLQKIKALF